MIIVADAIAGVGGNPYRAVTGRPEAARRVPGPYRGAVLRLGTRRWPWSRRSTGVGPVLAVIGWAALLAIAVLWGRHLLPGGQLNVKAPPFLGTYRLALASIVPAAVFAALATAVLPSVCRWLPWRFLMLTGWASAAAWAVLLAFQDGHKSLHSPISRPREYVAAVPEVGSDPVGWLGTFAERAAARDHPLHVNGHPPLMVLVLWAWDRLGFSGGMWAAVLVIGAGSSAVVALAVTVRALGDESAARRALPFLVLAPFAITIATSADAFFLGVGAWAAAALATGARRGSPLRLATGGLLAGSLPYLSYGLVPLAAVLAVAAYLGLRASGGPLRPGSRPWSGVQPWWVGVVVAGLLVAPVLFTLGGFWWPDGVAATHEAWVAGKGDDRPYLYSFVAGFAILGVLVGPATVVGAVLRRRGQLTASTALAGASLLGLVALAVSGVTRLEVERIWLPYAPWLVLMCAALPRQRRWLVVNALVALVFQALVLGVW